MSFKNGSFDTKVLKELEALCQDYFICPGYGDDDETTYFVDSKTEPSGFISIQDVDSTPWGDDFLDRWNNLKDEVLFTGEIFSIVSKRFVWVNDKPVKTFDRVVRGFGRAVSKTVLEILGVAYHVLVDPNGSETMTQGYITEIGVGEKNHIPTLYL